MTEIFKITGENVWADERIKSALLQLSFGKCAYCECELTTEAKYMEVEHFAFKEDYPDEVVEWNNLLPSCKRCNTTKGAHDVKKEIIVNPFLDYPKAHFSFAAYRFRPISKIGETTSIVIGINHSERAVKVRFQIGEQIHSAVDSAIDRLDNYQQNATNLRKRKLIASVEGLLSECLPSVPYSATAATVLHKHSRYDFLKKEMEASGVWTLQLESLHLEIGRAHV